MNALVKQTEITVGRAPVQIAEIQTQRCANEFGCGGCRAGLGNFDTSDLTVNFAQVGLGSDYAGSSATLTRIAGGINVAATGANSAIQANGVTVGFDGDAFRFVVVSGRLNAGSIDDATLFYDSDAGGGFTAARSMQAVNFDRSFRGGPAQAVKAGDLFVLVFDAAEATNYATDWQGATVDGFSLEVGTGADLDFDLLSITASDQSLFDARGSECYRTRATCRRLADYRTIVDGHLVPTNTLRDGDTITAADFNRGTNAFFVAEVRPATTPSGTIFAIGSASNFAYLGFTGSDLVFAVGGNTAADQARASVAASVVAARTVTLVAEIDFDGDAVNIWEFDGVERELTLLATDSAGTALTAAWAAATDGQVGTDGGNTYGTEDGGDFAGRVRRVRAHDGILFDGSASEVWRLRQFFGSPIGEKPADDDKAILPYLVNVSTAPTKVSLAGSNRNTDPIGNRASVTLTLTDQPSSDRTDDPYLSDRLNNPLDRVGSFWATWRIRQKFGRVGARLQVYEGYRGQLLSEMRRRGYLMDKLDLSNRLAVTIRGRDILSKVELGKAQHPPQSSGLLAVALADTGETTITLSDATVDDYPAPGTVRINKELFTYSATAVNGGDPELVDLTITLRATDRSEAEAHAIGDSVQICARFTDVTVSDALTTLLADVGEIDGQFLDLANWELEDETYLSAYLLTTLITSPTSVAQLVGGLTESVASFIFWDERDQLVKLEAFKALASIPTSLTEDRDIIADSFSLIEKPREQATRVQVSYNPVSFTEELRAKIDFINGYIDANTDLEDVDAYGVTQIRTILSRWLTTLNQAVQTASRLANRYQDVPVEVTLAVDAKDRALWIGDIVRLRHFQLVDEFGDLDTSRTFIITSAEDVVAGEIVRYTMEDSTLAGFIYVITPNDQPDYTGDADVDGFYAFISDAAGNYSDGSRGATIS